MKVSPFTMKYRPDQTAYTLNTLIERVAGMEESIRVMSSDKKNVIIIGNQPVDKTTGKPYPFGIHTYRVKGDRLEVIE